jgi:hypothetical protein
MHIGFLSGFGSSTYRIIARPTGALIVWSSVSTIKAIITIVVPDAPSPNGNFRAAYDKI